jgi:predicted outer membrane repeat protein
MAFVSGSSASFIGELSFTSNVANRDGGAIYINSSFVEFDHNKNFHFIGNKALENGGAMSLVNASSVSVKGYAYFEKNSSTFSGGALNVNSSFIEFSTESRAHFIYNIASQNGGSINLVNGSTMVFSREITGFTSNTAYGLGGAINMENSLANFNTQSTIYFNYNTARSSGGALNLSNGAIAVFEGRDYGSINVYFENNVSSSVGGAIYADNSYLYFSSKTSVYFKDNRAKSSGSAIGLFTSSIVFEGTVYIENYVPISKGGSNALIYLEGSTISFKGNDSVFVGTTNASGRAISAVDGSSVFFSGANVRFEGFNSNIDGGVLYNDITSTISFASYTNVTANRNTAKNGGFMKYDKGNIETFYGNMNFSANTARKVNGDGGEGGSLYVVNGTTLVFYGDKTEFSNNRSYGSGGAIYIDETSYIDFSSTNLTASGNSAVEGGFMYLKNKDMEFYKSVSMTGNQAKEGGALRIERTTLSFEGSVSFDANKSTGNGGAIYSLDSYFKSGLNASVQFTNNVSSNSGGALYINRSSYIFNNSNTQFVGNISRNMGGAIYFVGNSWAEFNGDVFHSSANVSEKGGAIYIDGEGSEIVFNNSQYTLFDSNRATRSGLGGAIYATNKAVVTFNSTSTYFQNNKASNYGGAVYVTKNATVNLVNANFIANTAENEGGGIYVDNGGVVNYTVEDFKETYIYQNISQKASIFGNMYYVISNGMHIGRGGTVNINLEGEYSMLHIVDIISSTEGANLNIYGDGYARLYTAGDIYTMSLSSSAEFDVLSQATLKISVLNVKENSSFGLGKNSRMFVDKDLFIKDEAELLMADGSFIVGSEQGKGGRVHISSNASLKLQNYEADSVMISTVMNNNGTFSMDVFANAKHDQIIALDYLMIGDNSKLKLQTDLKNKDYRRKYYFLFMSNNKISGSFKEDNITLEDVFLSSYAVFKIHDSTQVITDYKVDYGKLFENRITIILDGDAPSITDISKTTLDMSFNQNSVALNMDKLSVLYAETTASQMDGSSFEGGDLDYIITTIYEDLNNEGRLAALSEIAPYFIANIFLSQSIVSSRDDIYSRLGKRGDYDGAYGTWARYQGGITTYNEDKNSIGSLRNSNSGTLFGIDKFEDIYQIEYGFFGRYNSASAVQGNSNATIETYSFGLYGGLFEDEVELRTLLGTNIGRYEVNRAIYPFGRMARSEFVSVDGSFDIEASYLMNSSDFNLRPFAGINVRLLHQPEIKETGAQSLSLEYESKFIPRTSIRSGVATNGDFFEGALRWSSSLAINLMLFGSDPTFKASLENTNEPFEYKGVDTGIATLELFLSADYAVSDSVSLYLGGSFRGGLVYQDYSGSFGIRYFLD